MINIFKRREDIYLDWNEYQQLEATKEGLELIQEEVKTRLKSLPLSRGVINDRNW